MIAKGKSISHGTAALEYDLAKEINGEAAATEIHHHELFGCTGEEMVQEMKPYFVDFPNVKNNCLRFEVSPSVEESAGMTNADWAKLGNDFMQRMGLMNHQYIIVKHSGTEKNRRHPAQRYGEQKRTSPPAYTGKPCVVIGRTLQRQLDREESNGSRQQYSQRAELGTVKGHRQSQQGRDKTGYERCPCQDAGI